MLSIILGILMGACILILVVIENASAEKRVLIAGLLLILIVIVLVGSYYTTQKETYQKALDYNPYEKEYVYKQINDEYIIVDSTYIKKD